MVPVPTAVDDTDVGSVLHEMLTQHLSEEANQRIAFRPWAMKVPEAKTGPLDFNRFPFQRELYSQPVADAQEMVVKKATQVGVSTLLLRWAMYLADTRGFTVLYLFPKRQQMYDFADARIKSAIDASSYLTRRVRSTDVQNKGLKKIGIGYLYCRGSESKDDLQSIDADGLCMDEYDDIRPENIPDAERRLSGSKYGLIRRVGVPDLPNQGVDKLYAASDMRRWMVKCEACGEHQHLTFENIDLKTATLKCRECHKGGLDPRKGEWVAEHPDRSVRGYHIPRMMVPGTDLQKIIDASKKTTPEEKKAHINKDLGLAYADEQGQLSKEAIQRAQRSEVRRSYIDHDGQHLGGLRTMGVDVASTRALNVRASWYAEDGTKTCLHLGTAEKFDDVVRLMRLLDIHMCVVDHLPEGRLARAFAEEFPGRVFLANYAGNQTDVLVVDTDRMTVSAKRVNAIDAAFDMIRTQRNRLPGDLPEDYIRDMQNLIRTVEVDKLGKKKVSYERMGPDDFAHAEVYDLLASEVWHYIQAVEDARKGDGTEQPLDELVDFERADLQGDSDDYDPGFEDDDYRAGLDDF